MIRNKMCSIVRTPLSCMVMAIMRCTVRRELRNLQLSVLDKFAKALKDKPDGRLVKRTLW